MTLRYLLDTNVLSEPVRPAPHFGVVSRLLEHSGETATAAPVWNELLFGCERLPLSRKRTFIEAYLFKTVQPSIPILPYDEAAAQW